MCVSIFKVFRNDNFPLPVIQILKLSFLLKNCNEEQNIKTHMYMVLFIYSKNKNQSDINIHIASLFSVNNSSLVYLHYQ